MKYHFSRGEDVLGCFRRLNYAFDFYYIFSLSYSSSTWGARGWSDFGGLWSCGGSFPQLLFNQFTNSERNRSNSGTWGPKYVVQNRERKREVTKYLRCYFRVQIVHLWCFNLVGTVLNEMESGSYQFTWLKSNSFKTCGWSFCSRLLFIYVFCIRVVEPSMHELVLNFWSDCRLWHAFFWGHAPTYLHWRSLFLGEGHCSSFELVTSVWLPHLLKYTCMWLVFVEHYKVNSPSTFGQSCVIPSIWIRELHMRVGVETVGGALLFRLVTRRCRTCYWLEKSWTGFWIQSISSADFFLCAISKCGLVILIKKL